MGKFNIRTVFAYDWPLTLAGVEHIAGDACAIELVGAYRSPSDMVAALADVDCDIALVDYSIRGGPPMDCLALLAWLRRMRPGVGTVALVGSESR